MAQEIESQKIPPPLQSIGSIGELSTHLSYLRRDTDQNKIDMKFGFDEVKKSLEAVNKKLDNLTDGYVTRTYYDEQHRIMENHITDHEKRIRDLENVNEKISNLEKSVVAFASKDDVNLIKKILFGGISLILVAVVGAVLSGVIN